MPMRRGNVICVCDSRPTCTLLNLVAFVKYETHTSAVCWAQHDNVMCMGLSYTDSASTYIETARDLCLTQKWQPHYEVGEIIIVAFKLQSTGLLCITQKTYFVLHYTMTS